MSTDSHNRPSSVHSRPRTSSHTTLASITLVDQPETPILPSEDAAALLHEIPSHSRDASTHRGSRNKPNKKAWLKPSPWWLMGTMPLLTIMTSAINAPRIQLYTTLICEEYKPGAQLSHPTQTISFAGLSAHSKVVTSPVPPNNSFRDSDIYWASSTDLPVDQDASHDEKPHNPCASNPTVQATVAKLIAIIASVQGILSCITTSWWSSFSDRYGRSTVLIITVLGSLVVELTLISVVSFPKYVPGGRWFLLVGAVAEGCAGGMTTASAAMHAYIADVTPEASRSRMFSLNLGLIFTGVAIGPTLGSLFIRFTGEPLLLFYLAVIFRLLIIPYIWFIMPESLSKKYMELSRRKHAQRTEDLTRQRADNHAAMILAKLQRIFSFLSPLSILLPTYEQNGNPLKKPRRDWNLMFITVAFGLGCMLISSIPYKIQYAAATFGWTTEQLGYWISIAGASRAAFLAIIFPVMIKVIKPKHVVIETPAEPSETQPLIDPSENNEGTPHPLTRKKEVHSLGFDLGVARLSLLVDILAYTLMGAFLTPVLFVFSTVLISMGSGFSPAIHAVALSLYMRSSGTHETGKLFGAMSVLQAISSEIIGPAIYGTIYASTVATFPRAIFLVSAGNVFIALILIMSVRLRPHDTHANSVETLVQEDVDINRSDNTIAQREDQLVDI